jgi:hypothetical protein
MRYDYGHRVVGMWYDNDILDVLEKEIGGENVNVEMICDVVVIILFIV